jgi:hypothetical protein
MRKLFCLAASSILLVSAASAQQPSLVIDAKPTLRQFGPGTRFTFICKPNLQIQEVWGTDMYTDTSPLCSAAVHAGVIQWSRGGAITVDVVPGERAYLGSLRNRVLSLTWKSHDRSYTFIRGASGGAIDWGTTATKIPYTFATPLDLVCPKGDDATLKSAAVYGTDIYSDTSPICVAAVHAGVIGIGGGRVRLASRGPQASFTASTRFGVTTRAYGEWEGSYSLSHVPTRTIPDSVTRTPTRPVVPSSPPSTSLTSDWAPTLDVNTIATTIDAVEDTLDAVLSRMKQYGSEASFASLESALTWVGNTVGNLSNYVVGHFNPASTRPSLDEVKAATRRIYDEATRIVWSRTASTRIATSSQTPGFYDARLELLDSSGSLIPARTLVYASVPLWTVATPSCAYLNLANGYGWIANFAEVSCPTAITATLSKPPSITDALAPISASAQIK